MGHQSAGQDLTWSHCRVIQTVSGCKVDVERAEVGSTALERKVMLKGTSQQISQAKKMIEEKVSDGEWMRNSVTNSRQPRVKTTQPLFLNYQDDSNEEANINIGIVQYRYSGLSIPAPF